MGSPSPCFSYPCHKRTTMTEEHRIERDTLGEVQVPAAAYYGPQTARARVNFPISGAGIPRHVIRGLGLIKADGCIPTQRGCSGSC